LIPYFAKKVGELELS